MLPPDLVPVQLGRDRAKRCPYCYALYGLTGPQKIGPHEIDPVARTARYWGRPVCMSDRSFDLLLLLASRSVVSPETIIHALDLDSDEHDDAPEDLVRMAVYRLRRALGDNAAVENIWGRGYRLGFGRPDLPITAHRRHVALWREFTRAPEQPQHWRSLADRSGISTHVALTKAISELRPMVPTGEIITYWRRGLYAWIPDHKDAG